MAQPWFPADRQQQDIHRRLRLVGGEPAAFFLDACRIVESEPSFLATTHLVGHLLREIEGGLRQVIEPLVGSLPAQGVPDRQTKVIDAMCTALGIDDENFRGLWRTYATQLHEWAHRHARNAPRAVAAEFRQIWSQALTVLDYVTRRVEASYALALPVAASLALRPPDVAAFQQELLHSPVVLDRFFQAAGTEWLEPLREAGVFDNPPGLVPRDDGTIAFTRWPPGAFLVRCTPEMPEAVLQIALDLDTDNPEAHESLIDAALTMSPDLAARLVPRVESWLGSSAQWQLPFKARDLGIALVLGGRITEGLSLIRALVVSCGFQRGHGLGAGLVKEIASAIFPAAGVAGVDALADLLAESLQDEQGDGQDYTYVWRPSLTVEVRQDIRDALISAVRDGTDAIVGADPESIKATLASLEAQPLPIFRRLSLRILLEAPLSTVAEYVHSHVRLDDLATEGECAELLAARSSELDGEAQRFILEQIDPGPGGIPSDDDLAERWRWRWLSCLPRPLPGAWEQRYTELVERFGEPDAGADAEEPARARWAESPVSADALGAMAVPDLIAYLRAWTPDETDWAGPRRAGLESELRAAVAARPEDFADAAEDFANLRPEYARALLSGLEEARRQGRSFPWSAVLRFASTVLDEPRDASGQARSKDGVGDEGWRSVRQGAAHLICHGLGGDSRIPVEERDRVWSVISRLASDANPTPAEEAGRGVGGGGPAGLALNSVRGAAMRAVMAYVLWLHDPAAGASAAMPPEARELLDRNLDPALEPSPAIRSVYGSFFPYLAGADPPWAETNAQRIFPAKPDDLWRAAWESYIQFNRLWPTPFRLLIEQYSRAIRDLATGRPDGVEREEPAGSLVNHLVLAARWGLIDGGCEGGLLEEFFATASVDLRALAIRRVGMHLTESSTLSDEERERLRRLWECRLAAVQGSTDPDAGIELRGFGWWFASGAFDADWSLQHVIAAMDAAGPIDGERDVVRRLEELYGEQPVATLRALERLIDVGSSEWFVYGVSDTITPLLQRALAGSDGCVRIARDIVGLLVSRGHGDFGRLSVR